MLRGVYPERRARHDKTVPSCPALARLEGSPDCLPPIFSRFNSVVLSCLLSQHIRSTVQSVDVVESPPRFPLVSVQSYQSKVRCLPLLFAAHGQGMLPRCDLADLFAGLYLVAELPHRHAEQEPPVRMGNRITPPVVDASDLP